MSGRHPYDLGWPDYPDAPLGWPDDDPYTQDEVDWLDGHEAQDGLRDLGMYEDA